MALMQVGSACAFAFGNIDPDAVKIVDLPKGARVRIRSRRGEFLRAFVRTKHGTAVHYLIKDMDLLTMKPIYRLGHKQSENFRAKYALIKCGRKKPMIGVERQIIRFRPKAPRKLCLP